MYRTYAHDILNSLAKNNNFVEIIYRDTLLTFIKTDNYNWTLFFNGYSICLISPLNIDIHVDPFEYPYLYTAYQKFKHAIILHLMTDEAYEVVKSF